MLTVTPRDVWITPGPTDAPWQRVYRQECEIATPNLTEGYRVNGNTKTVFLLEGVAMRLVIPGQTEKGVLRSSSKRTLSDYESWAEMAVHHMVHGKSFP